MYISTFDKLERFQVGNLIIYDNGKYIRLFIHRIYYNCKNIQNILIYFKVLKQKLLYLNQPLYSWNQMKCTIQE